MSTDGRHFTLSTGRVGIEINRGKCRHMCNTNRTIFQFFHWYYSAEENLWNHAADEAARLAQLGVTEVWLPPAYKSALGMKEPGYAVYDLYDLGEFDQKGSIRTLYGTRDQYIAAVRAFQQNKVKVLADIVLNHKLGGDEEEVVAVRKVDTGDRNAFTAEQENIHSFTRFTFPGRQRKYSDFVWDMNSFTGLSHSDGSIGLIMNEYSQGSWEPLLENELGNFDYLMGNDIEYRNPYVREELKRWGKWYVETTGVDGFRLDALKHINPDFFPEWLAHLNDHFKKDFFAVGEYWQDNAAALEQYIDATHGRIQLFDVPLHQNLHRASMAKDTYDLRRIFDHTLVGRRPISAITFVDNHDTQPMQSLESPVDFWFKPLAYALILLREQGIPCVFYVSIYEAKYKEKKEGKDVLIELNKVPGIENMMKTRSLFAYGFQHDYFDDEHLIGWTRYGIPERPLSACAVLLSNGIEGQKTMCLGKNNAGKKFRCIVGNRPESVELNNEGEGLFYVFAHAVSVWINQDAEL